MAKDTKDTKSIEEVAEILGTKDVEEKREETNRKRAEGARIRFTETDRAEVLKLYAEGKTIKEISELYVAENGKHVGDQTVSKWIADAANKNGGASQPAQAAAKATIRTELFQELETLAKAGLGTGWQKRIDAMVRDLNKEVEKRSKPSLADKRKAYRDELAKEQEALKATLKKKHGIK